jgi:hypothetical protein
MGDSEIEIEKRRSGSETGLEGVTVSLDRQHTHPSTPSALSACNREVRLSFAGSSRLTLSGLRDGIPHSPRRRCHRVCSSPHGKMLFSFRARPGICDAHPNHVLMLLSNSYLRNDWLKKKEVLALVTEELKGNSHGLESGGAHFNS